MSLDAFFNVRVRKRAAPTPTPTPTPAPTPAPTPTRDHVPSLLHTSSSLLPPPNQPRTPHPRTRNESSRSRRPEVSITYVYTDGSCQHNGKANARAGIGVYFGPEDLRNVSAPVHGKQTNNTAEVQAILRAYQLLQPDMLAYPSHRYVIVTDSEYAIRCATTYGQRQAAAGWQMAIPNKALVRQLHATISQDPQVTLMKVSAHTTFPPPPSPGVYDPYVHERGNAVADALAYAASVGRPRADAAKTLPTTRAHPNKHGRKASRSPRRSPRRNKSSSATSRVYLRVPFADKDVAKSHGARWDPGRKKWYAERSLRQEQWDELMQRFPVGGK